MLGFGEGGATSGSVTIFISGMSDAAGVTVSVSLVGREDMAIRCCGDFGLDSTFFGLPTPTTFGFALMPGDFFGVTLFGTDAAFLG